jgi:hypothetical protein
MGANLTGNMGVKLSGKMYVNLKRERGCDTALEYDNEVEYV